MSLPGREDKEGTAQVATMYFGEGKSYQEIAEVFGVSREAVRQFLNRRFPDRVGGRTFRQELVAADKAVAEEKDLEKRIAEAPACVVCYEPVTRRTGGRGNNRTCKPEHSDLWSRARFLLDPELRKRQRLSMANSILRHKKSHLPSSIGWAERLVEGEPINTKNYKRANSGARKAFEEVMRIRAKNCSVCGTLDDEKKATKHHLAHMKGKI